MARRIRNGLFGKCIAAASIAFAASSLSASTARASDTWNPENENAVFFRNNTTTNFTVSAAKVWSSQTCLASNYSYTNGYSNVSVNAADMVEVLDINNSACLTTADSWRFSLKKAGCSTQQYIYVTGSGAFSTDGVNYSSGSVDKSVTFCGTAVTINMFGRSQLYESGAYVTIGTDPFGELGPSSDDAADTLTVTSFNTYQGTESKPEICTRGTLMASVLAQLDTDVLVLEEMNLRKADCFDGLELAAYLWTGDATSTGDDWIENDSYASSMSGSGTSPNGDDRYSGANGAFPYISQFVSGIAVNGNEEQTGGVVVLSKYPITMVANETYSTVRWNDQHKDEQKGFIVVKVEKGSQPYFIVATHTTADDSSKLAQQVGDIEEWLASHTTEVPSGSRVILAGDLNSDGTAGEFEPLFVDIDADGYDRQTLTQYYPYSRDTTVNFYHTDDGSDEQQTIDWVLPIGMSMTGHRFTAPTAFEWHAFPVRSPSSFKFAELSDHFAVTGTFTY